LTTSAIQLPFVKSHHYESNMGRKYNLIIFGATGFTGKYVVETAKRTQKESNETFTWAVAGRSIEKLNTTLKELSQESGKF